MPVSRVAAPVKRATPRQSAREGAAAQATARSDAFTRRKDGIEGLGTGAALLLMVRKQYADAQAVGMHSGPIAYEVAKICETNEGIAKWVDYFSSAGPYTDLLKASLPLVLQIMANHGALPDGAGAQLGVVSKDTLELAGKAEQEKVEAAILLQIKMSQDETAKLKAELNGSRVAPDAR